MDHNFGILLIGISILMLWLNVGSLLFTDKKVVKHICTCDPLPPIAPMMMVITNAGTQHMEEKRRYTEIMELMNKVYETYQTQQGRTHPVASPRDQVRIRELLSEFDDLRWVVMNDPLYSEMLHSHYVGLMKTLLAERKAPRLPS